MKEKWAYVTGATSGIGKAIANELAQKNYNLIIHGRNELELKKSATELAQKSKVSVLVFAKELAHPQAFEDTISFFKEHKIIPEVIVNNAGFGIAGNFADTDSAKEEEMIAVHCTYPIKICKYLFKNKIAPQNYILNVSSLYAFFPVPKQSIYAASKAFIHSFTLATYKENKKNATGIHLATLCPGLTYSRFRTRQGKEEDKQIVGMSSDAVAKIAVRDLFKKKPCIIPGTSNKLMSFTLPKLPVIWSLAIVHKMNSSRGY